MLRIAIACGAVFGAALLVQPTAGVAGETAARRGPSGDPNEMVCVSQTAVGSRLARRRVCRTRAEWEQHQSEHKQEVERAQQQMQTHLIEPDQPILSAPQ